MKRARIILCLGLWIAVLPYLGFPYFWKNIIFTLSGFGLIYISFVIYREHKARHSSNTTFENFSENSDFTEDRRQNITAN